MSLRLQRIARALTMVAALHALAGPLRAEDPPAKVEARRHFQSGLALAGKGDFQGAVEAFESAYRTSPHYVVLYNLGQAYATLGRADAAVRTLERFLEEGGDKIPAARQNEVRQLIEREKSRLGRATLALFPTDSEAFVDGKPLEPGALEGIALTVGLHVVAARKDGYIPRAEAFDVVAGELVQLTLRLEPEFAELDSAVFLNARAKNYGSLKISVSEPSHRLSVDGKPYAGALLPAGPHVVAVEREGFVPWRSVVAVEAARQREVTVVLEPTAARIHEREAQTRRWRAWTLGTGIGGVALGGGAAALYAWNVGRYDDWRLGSDEVSPSEIQRVDTVALGMGITAGAALVASGILLLLGP